MTETNNSSIVIVGGGPSGASAAKAMLDRGYTNVNLYEAYPHPKTLSTTSSKAYVIALSPRGQQGILDATGIDVLKEASSKDSDLGVVSHHLARHVYNPKTKKTSSKPRPTTGIERTVVTRQALTGHLLHAAHESGAKIHYQHRLVEIDFDKKVAIFENDGKRIETSYDLLVAADGSRSKVRTLMVENKTTLTDFSARTAEDSMEYQVVTLPQNPFAETHPENTTHSWNNKELNAISLGFPIKKDGNNDSMLFAIVFPEGQLESFRKTGYETPLTKLLPDLFGDESPNRKANLEAFEMQLRTNQIANGGLCVWASGLGHASSGIVLLGDSGHGMWPSLGQGANCALESVAVFVKCLDELNASDKNSKKPWTSCLIENFEIARSDDAIAAVDLTYGGIGARESRGRMNAPLSSKLQMIGMMLLHKLTLGVVPMPALLRVLMGTKGLSYSTAKKFHFGYEKYICWGALASVVLVTTTLKGSSSFSGISGSDDL
eukprot:CAMPEP_0116094992 /NCGR_PEP_ID=MMETSP0327-20121206/9425_1 /TAXON_ID=44447 /ORGANISM="Pseudo-nitzschia delicatissima, Strain B596" /LENGTH=490 /DNA_ID=CAMNT_0003586629 /DNA_START=105 /DNA_END=1577 /DNA_ORIENTATION=-